MEGALGLLQLRDMQMAYGMRPLTPQPLARTTGPPVQFDRRPGDEQLNVLAQLLEERDAAYPTMASTSDGGIIYDAPQITPELSPFVDSPLIAALYSHRNPYSEMLAAPLRSLLQSLLGFDEVSVLDNDEYLKSLLVGGDTAEACPERLRGLYWMQDNVASEVLITFQDIEWESPVHEGFAAGGIKILKHNWSRDPTLTGTALSLSSNFFTREMPFYISPKFKWIWLNGGWIYVPDHSEYLVAPAKAPIPVPFAPGEKVPFDPQADLLRVDYASEWDGNSTVTYNYRVRRVLFIDDEGRLVKTSAWDELRDRMERVSHFSTDAEGVVAKQQQLNPRQLVYNYNQAAAKGKNNAACTFWLFC